MDLIYAEATPPGRGGLSVIRVSGRGVKAKIETLTGALGQARLNHLRYIRDGDDVLDQGLVVWFEEGRSFTGEESVELQLHGAPVIVRRVSLALQKLGARLAEPGEFMRRAFLSGRVDLAEVEGFGDLLAAETEAQRVLAIRTASGEMSRVVENWRGMLIRAGALVEVSVDFADEDVPDEVPGEVYEILRELGRQLDKEIDGFGAAERLRKGFEVAVIGPPNAGKSSLVNRIAKREVALVSKVAGTTRDVIELRLDLNGLAVTLLDTAGLRDFDDEVEGMGIGRARQRADAADLRLHLSESGEVVEELWREGDISVTTKADTRGDDVSGCAVSSITGCGISELLVEIYDALSQRVAGAGIVSHERQLLAMTAARDAISHLDALPSEFLAEAIRQAGSALNKLVGRIGAEEYFDVIFSSFCIGK